MGGARRFRREVARRRKEEEKGKGRKEGAVDGEDEDDERDETGSEGSEGSEMGARSEGWTAGGIKAEETNRIGSE